MRHSSSMNGLALVMRTPLDAVDAVVRAQAQALRIRLVGRALGHLPRS